MTNDPFELKILLEKFLEDNQRIHRKLNNLESHIVNFIYPTQELSKLINREFAPLVVDDRALRSLLKEFREVEVDFKNNINAVNLEQTLSEMKYIGKRMKEIEESLREIKGKGLKKEIHLEFSCDGYELVKKPKGYLPTDDIEEPIENLQACIDTLQLKEGQILIHRHGFFNEKKKTFAQIGEKFNVSGDRIRTIYLKILRKLRHPSRHELVKKTGNLSLIKEVFGKS